MPKNSNRLESLTIFYTIFLFVFALWVLWWILIINAQSLIRISIFPKDLSSLGHIYGAYNSLISGAAFAGIIYTLVLQRKEILLQRNELTLNRNELKDTRNALERTARIQALGVMIDQLKRSLDSQTNSTKSNFAQKKTLEEDLKYYVNELKSHLK